MSKRNYFWGATRSDLEEELGLRGGGSRIG